MADKKITLHPVKNGVVDENTNLYPKTVVSQILDNNRLQKTLTPGGGINISSENVISSTASNLENGTGTNSVREKMPHETITFNATKNPNAVALDGDLNADLPTGASGNQSTAVGKDTMALGINTLTNGNKTVAKGDESHAEGYQSVTLGDGSHAEGEQTTSAGSVSHSEGSNTVSGGVASHAEGVRSKTKAYNGIQDSGTGSHAEGESTEASGYCSHTEGFGSYTGKIENAPSYPDIPDEPGSGGGGGEPVPQVGNIAHAEGNYCFAVGTGSHAEGYHTQALHEASHAEGVGTRTSNAGQHVSGYYNADNSAALFIIGKGTADNARSNAFEVLPNGTAKVGAMGDDNLSVATKGYIDNNYQVKLVSGSTIKTVNGASLLGSGDITISAGGTISIDSTISSTSTNPVQNKVIYENYALKTDLSSYVPYTGATTDLNLAGRKLYTLGGVFSDSNRYAGIVFDEGVYLRLHCLENTVQFSSVAGLDDYDFDINWTPNSSGYRLHLTAPMDEISDSHITRTIATREYVASHYTNNTGTVTAITAGTGLNTTSNDTGTDGGTISSSGTLYLTKSGVTAGTYNGITVDKYGRITSANSFLSEADAKIINFRNTQADSSYGEIAVGGLFPNALNIIGYDDTIYISNGSTEDNTLTIDSTGIYYNGDYSTPGTEIATKGDINSAIANVYQIKGSDTPTNLNTLISNTIDKSTLNGYVYNIVTPGTLTNSSSSTTVDGGDNVVFLYNGGSWFWDKLAATISLSGYVPYTGATTDLDLGSHNLSTTGVINPNSNGKGFKLPSSSSYTANKTIPVTVNGQSADNNGNINVPNVSGTQLYRHVFNISVENTHQQTHSFTILLVNNSSTAFSGQYYLEDLYYEDFEDGKQVVYLKITDLNYFGKCTLIAEYGSQDAGSYSFVAIEPLTNNTISNILSDISYQEKFTIINTDTITAL